MAALQDPQVANVALGRVQSLQKLCLKVVGRNLKRFCNLRLHPAVAQKLSGPEKQLIYDYDLSRLDLFEAQDFLRMIDVWCAKVERNKRRRRHEHVTPKRIDYAMKRFLRYVLLPLAKDQVEDQLRELAHVLGLVAPPTLQLRAPTPSLVPRPKWICETNEQDDTNKEDNVPLTTTCNEATPPDSVICYRLPVASVGCGIIADKLQRTDVIVKLRLNNCLITDAGAILLSSGIRFSQTLRLFDVSNDESVYRDEESMDNEIGDCGVQAIALALELNKSVQQVDLSGNPVGTAGATALASMLRKNVDLQRLDLDRTFIRDGADLLIAAFEASNSLTQLNMQWCALRSGIGEMLAAVQAAKAAP